MCFGCSKEQSHRDGAFEYPQHMFWLRNKKNNFQLHTLIWGPGYENVVNVLDISLHIQYCLSSLGNVHSKNKTATTYMPLVKSV